MKLKIVAHTIVPELDPNDKLGEFRKLTEEELKILFNSTHYDSNESFDIYKALLLSAKLAGICYMKENFDKILNESAETSFRRLKTVLTSGHHSVFDHFHITFEISNIPKILAMFLNNEKNYTTSEKSARYTKYENLTGIQGELYNKWVDKLSKVIKETYPCLYNEKAKNPMLAIEKLAQENARYFVSIFEPSTTMAYTTSLRQWNYLIYMFEKYISQCDYLSCMFEDYKLKNFDNQALPALKEFLSLAKEYQVEGLIPFNKVRTLSLIGDPAYADIQDTFSYVYQTSYYASYACFAQVQRHRSEHCFLYNDIKKFILPEIISSDNALSKEWLSDGSKVIDIHPQGRIVKIVQTGNIDTFIMKYEERCCGSTQLETMRHQVEIADKIVQNSIYADKLLEITRGHTARCLFKNGFCNKKCMLGSKQIERKI